MGRFNLLDEPWISVLPADTDEKRDISLLELFRHAENYQTLAGEMETQNFAVMRFLLAVVQTVLSRFDLDGNLLPGVSVDERWIQTEAVDEDDQDDYCEAAESGWAALLKRGSFPDIIVRYLEKWRDRFYLFDEEHPFCQVNQREMDAIMKKIPKRSQPTTIYGKNLNRTISESENKPALFTPIAPSAKKDRSSKDLLTEAELIRWLLTFQGYSGLADKVSLAAEHQRSSKGWLFDLGGICLKGENVFETIALNYLPGSPRGIADHDFAGAIQRPCWEMIGSEVVSRLCASVFIDNLAELYTNWSRAVYIDPTLNQNEPATVHVVKLPEIEHTEQSLEPMTLWRGNEAGPNKGHQTPKKHVPEQALWRSFGLITMDMTPDHKAQKRPGVFLQFQRLSRTAGSRLIDLAGISMQDDGNATSWLPVDEISDQLRINDLVVTDTDPKGWITWINNAVETTKEVASVIFRSYLIGICEVRDLKVSNPMDAAAAGFIQREIAALYADIDPAFKEWLAAIQPEDEKEEKVSEWYVYLRRLTLAHGEALFRSSTARDLTGIEKEGKAENVATVYWSFIGKLSRKLGRRECVE